MPAAEPPVAETLARVLGLPSGGAGALRPDTPLAALGVDSLALLCVADALADEGWLLDPQRARQARSLGDLRDSCGAAS